MSSSESVSVPKAPRERSPAYPFISLKTAIARLKEFDTYFGRHPAAPDKAGLAWKMKGGSSQAAQTLAALKAFGLVDYQGGGKDRVAVISNDGRTYLRAQQENVKRTVLKRAALMPKAMAKFWPVWGFDRPPDAVCLDELVLKHGFSQSAAPVFLKVYDDTIAYALLSKTDKDVATDEDTTDDDKPDAEYPIVNIGDFIQWTSDGQDQFRPARRVTWVSEDGKIVRVIGSMTGIPANQVTVVEPPAHPPETPSGEELRSPPSDKNDISVFLTGNRLQITADIDAKGIKKMRDVLEKYEDILSLLAGDEKTDS